MKPRLGALLVALTVQIAASQPADTPTTVDNTPDPSNTRAEPFWNLDIYPLLLWAPIFGGSFNLPAIPAGGLPGVRGGLEGTAQTSGATSLSFSGAAAAGVYLRVARWIVEFDGEYAGLSASRTTRLARVSLSSQGFYGNLIAGYQVVDHLAVTAGVRRLGARIDAQVGDLLDIVWKPGFWDPLVGLDWRARLGRSWTTEIRLEGGGFGVGSDVDVSGTFRADWRFARHFGMTMGYSALHYQNTDTILHHNFKSKQTFNGPIFGFGIYI